MQADEMTDRLAVKAEPEPEPEPAPLIDRVERLEAIVQRLAEQGENHGESLARVGSRLTRAEKHVGLPSTDA